MAEPGALTAALNWYRAVPLSDLRDAGKKVTVPTMFVWSDGDIALLEKGARLSDAIAASGIEDPSRVFAWFQDWRAEGFFSGIDLPARPRRR